MSHPAFAGGSDEYVHTVALTKMVIVVNIMVDPSSNPQLGCFAFHCVLMPFVNE